MGLREGKNREIKKVLEHLGLAVNRLIRVSFGPFELGDLAEGEVGGSAHPRAARPTGREARQGGERRFRRAAHHPRRAGARAEPRRAAANRARAARENRWRRAGDAGACRIGARAGEHGPNAMRRRAARRRGLPRPSAAASMSRRCGRRSPPTRRARAGASSAARRTTARGARSPSSAFHRPGMRRGDAPPPKRARRAPGAPRSASAADGRFEAGARPGRPDSFKTGRARGGEGRERPPRSDRHGAQAPRRLQAARAKRGDARAAARARLRAPEEKRDGERQIVGRNARRRSGARTQV